MGEAASVLDDRPGDNWAAHRDRTRRAIIGAFLQMLVDENPTTVSMPAVARRAGVSIRTLYRYMPNKDALVEAASTHMHADLAHELGREPTTAELPEYLARLWPTLATNIPGVWVQQTNETGREMRRRRLENRRRVLTEDLQGRVPDEHLTDTVDSIVAISSSSMMIELVDRMGHRPERAAELAARIVRLVVDDATRSAPSPTATSPDERPHTSTRQGGPP